MQFAIGHQLADADEPTTAELVVEYRQHVAEVYFAWPLAASGRAPVGSRRGYVDWRAQRRVEEDLAAIRGMGVRLDLLFNANCYGHLAISENLANQVRSVLDHLGERIGGVETVTTTSPAVAHVVRTGYPGIDVRASVNMRIGTIQGMSYVADLFDSYYVQREFNRDLAHLVRLRQWADAHGKQLYLLANSGCLSFCSGQTFHDNLVAHEHDVDETRNMADFSPFVCRQALADPANLPLLLSATWIRPEDLHRYESLFPVVKLATRMHANSRLVLEAYSSRQHFGNLLDLLEPGYGQLLAPQILDNRRFPANWFQRTSTCGRHCESCDYCREVLGQVLEPTTGTATVAE